MSNEELRHAVDEELSWEPRVDNAAVAVETQAGIVTLRGTVGSLRERFEARKAAKRVYGVRSVNDELEVRILGEKSRDDADLRGAVLQALMLDSEVPSSVDARAKNGVVTLTGTVTYYFEREEAESVTSKVSGVSSIDDQIELRPPGPSADDVHHSIKKALERNAKIDAADISVDSSHGTVRLFGVVDSWANHDAAVAAAWAAPGVTKVEDEIVVDY
ncbi:MAG TPA: BON domain-containing protein [Thermoleophilaceae bacterium]